MENSWNFFIFAKSVGTLIIIESILYLYSIHPSTVEPEGSYDTLIQRWFQRPYIRETMHSALNL